MPLKIVYNGPFDAPKCFCDYCGKEITEAADGNYQWPYENDQREDGASVPVFFTHKRCCRAFEAARGGAWGAIDLECLPYYLAKNLHVAWRKSQGMARFMAGLS